MGAAKHTQEAGRLRIKGQIKMGYYPTPNSVIALIKPRLVFPDEPFAALDPCCGKGEALAGLVAGTRAATYGVELDLERARESENVLATVAKGAFELSKVPKNAFSLLLLNPPYDWQSDTDESTRKEYAFLREASPALVPGGVLVYIIPDARVSRKVVHYLDYAFDQHAAARFPKDEYERFHQIVIVCQKKRVKGCSDASVERLMLSMTRDDRNLGRLEALSDVWSVPPTPPEVTIEGNACYAEEAEDAARASPVLPAFRRSVVPEDREVSAGQPPTPLHKGHISLLLAAGHLDGLVGEGPDAHLVRGTVTKEEREISSEETDHGKITRVLITHRITIKALTSRGEVKTLT